MDDQEYKRLINGDWAYGKNIIARCHSPSHRGFLTRVLIEKHECIEKKCYFFQRLKPKRWLAVEQSILQKRALSQDKRKLKERELEKQNNRDALIRSTLEGCGHVHVTSIEEESPRTLRICYIYDERVDLKKEICFLREKLKKFIKLKAIIAPKENIESLIRKPKRETSEDIERASQND
jgi:hypothetical protein